jgi:hypothetical protein
MPCPRAAYPVGMSEPPKGAIISLSSWGVARLGRGNAQAGSRLEEALCAAGDAPPILRFQFGFYCRGASSLVCLVTEARHTISRAGRRGLTGRAAGASAGQVDGDRGGVADRARGSSAARAGDHPRKREPEGGQRQAGGTRVSALLTPPRPSVCFAC